MTEPTLRVISLGAGVQSSALLLMAQEGRFEAKPDLAIFADTGWEPQAVYDHLAHLEEISEIPIVRIQHGNIREDALDASKRTASMPLYVINKTGKQGTLKRQCTAEYKIQPIYHELRRRLGGKVWNGAVELWMGISLDEATRMKPARVKWVVNRWPLIEQRLSRNDCALWMQRSGYPKPPKSACIGCPYHDKATWRRMKQDDPVSFADAVDFDEQVRSMSRIDGAVYVSREMKPLAEVDFRNEEDGGQLAMDLFDAECEGMCGI